LTASAAPPRSTARSVFTATTTSIFLSDASSTSQIGVTVGTVASASITDGTGSNAVDISSDTLADATGVAAQTALGHIDSAIANVASIRGAIGAGINRLQSAVNVINNQVQNLTSAEDGIRAADIRPKSRTSPGSRF